MSALEIEARALSLPLHERARLAERLLASLNGEDEQDVEQAWAEEAARRLDELRTGTVQGVPLEDVLAELRARQR